MALFNSTGWLLKGGSGALITGNGESESDFTGDSADDPDKVAYVYMSGKPNFYRSTLSFSFKVAYVSLKDTSQKFYLYFKYKRPSDGKFTGHISTNKQVTLKPGNSVSISIKDSRLENNIKSALMNTKANGGTSDVFISFRNADFTIFDMIRPLEPDFHCNITPY